MADAAIGSVSLAIQLCKGLVWYIDGTRGAKDRASQIAEDLVNLAHSLEILDSVVKKRPESPSRDAILAGIVGCAGLLRKIEKKLGSGQSTDETSLRNRMRVFRQLLVSPFKQDDITFFKDLLESMKGSLQLILSALQLEAMNDTNRQVARLHQSNNSSHDVLKEQIRYSQHETLRHISYQTSLIQSSMEISQSVVEMQAGVEGVKTHLQPLASDIATVAIRLSQLEAKFSDISFDKFKPSTINEEMSGFNDIAQDLKRIKKKKRPPQKRCMCQNHTRTTPYLRWPFQFESTKTTMHNPSCRYSSIEQAVSNLQMRFVICSILLGQKVHIGFALSHAAGRIAMSKVVLECNRIVSDDSPAFELIWAYIHLVAYKTPNRLIHMGETQFPDRVSNRRTGGFPQRFDLNYEGMDQMCEVALHYLTRLFDSGKASPYDRLRNGQTLLHYFCKKIDCRYNRTIHSNFTNDVFVTRLLDYIGMHGLEKDEYGNTCMDYLIEIESKDNRMIEQFMERGIFPTWNLVSTRGDLYEFLHICGQFEGLTFLLEEEIINCSYELKVLLLRSEEMLHDLGMKGITSWEEREFQYSFYEVATSLGWRRGCEILLEHGIPVTGGKILEIARFDNIMLDFWLSIRSSLTHGELTCLGGIEDIVVSMTEESDQPECFNLGLSALVQQAEELQILATKHGINVSSDRILNAQAHAIIYDLEKQGVHIRPWLKPTRRSVYHVPSWLWTIKVLDAFFESGFRDLVASDFNDRQRFFAVSPLLYMLTHRFWEVRGLDRLVPWFLSHGADLSENWPNSKVTLAHVLGHRIGEKVFYFPGLLRAESFSSYVTNQQDDGCHCHCSNSGCTLITSIYKSVPGIYKFRKWCPSHPIQLRNDAHCWRTWANKMTAVVQPVVQVPENIWLVGEVIRLVLFHKLEIRHTCCDIERIMWRTEPDYSIRPNISYEEKEIESIHEEDAFLINLLEELMEKFEQWWDERKISRSFTEFIAEDVLSEIDRVLKNIKEEDHNEFHEGRRKMGVMMDEYETSSSNDTRVVELEEESYSDDSENVSEEDVDNESSNDLEKEEEVYYEIEEQ
ncbi:hypothetical protein B0J11DRAFT_594653 [Dendryphion nanum]|uniref:Fungal N-terminal domain-containing protein n=1 Tax=Dendryphion nanum TaxID=256645 RepID=A0A9P9D9Z6_9PLEO|nr:hypothetical protein B0J11DRAFT_594653 [Dendryphion nanum]